MQVDAPAPPAADAKACQALVDALPDRVSDQPRREVASGASYAAAWGDPALTLVCGVPRPAGFDQVAVCTTVNGVDWFIPQDQLDAMGDLTMTTVNREVLVRVQMPGRYGPPAATLADLSAAVKAATPRTSRCR